MADESRIDPQSLRLSPSGAAILKRREGFRSTPKQDVDLLAIGYGFQRWKGKPITRDLKITQEEADAEFDRLAEEHYGKLIRDELTRPITQDEYDALVSVAWNSERAGVNLAKRLNKGQQLTEQHFTASGTVKGKPYEPLQIRRRGEYGQFTQGRRRDELAQFIEARKPTQTLASLATDAVSSPPPPPEPPPPTLPGEMTARQGLALMMGGPVPTRTRRPSATPVMPTPPATIPTFNVEVRPTPEQLRAAFTSVPPSRPPPMRVEGGQVVPSSVRVTDAATMQASSQPEGGGPQALDDAIAQAVARKRGAATGMTGTVPLDQAIAQAVARKSGTPPAAAQPPGWPAQFPNVAGVTRGALGTLPVIGAVVGGALATPGTVGAGTIPGAVLGGGVGQGARDLISEAIGLEHTTPTQKAGSIVKEVAIGATAGVAAKFAQGVFVAARTPGLTVGEFLRAFTKNVPGGRKFIQLLGMDEQVAKMGLENAPASILTRPPWQAWASHNPPTDTPPPRYQPAYPPSGPMPPPDVTPPPGPRPVPRPSYPTGPPSPPMSPSVPPRAAPVASSHPPAPIIAPAPVPAPRTATLKGLAKPKLTALESRVVETFRGVGFSDAQVRLVLETWRKLPASWQKVEFLDPFVQQVVQQANVAGRMPPR